MDVIFVNAIYFWNEDNINVGQLILRDILKDEYKVDCINFDYLNKMKIIQYVEDFNENIRIMGDYIINQNPKIVGFYTICNVFVITLKLAEYIKVLKPDINIIFGGPQASVTKDECLNAFSFIDVICIGESENSIKPLIKTIINKGDLSKVPGITYKENDKIITTKHAPLIKNQELSYYTVYNFKPFTIDPNKFFMIEGGRGCPYSCTFCTTSNFWERKYRVKPVNAVIDEMIHLNKIYGVHKFSILHDMFTADREYIYEFCNMLINVGMPFEWRCSSRVDVLDKQLIDLLRQSNCKSIYIGIETGSSRMQKIINKNLNLDYAMDIIEYIKSIGIDVTASFIFCFPDETISDFKDTIELIQKCIYVNIYNTQLHYFMPLPNTIETKKIEKEMYFDNDVLETSLRTIKLDDTISNIIKSYPSIFSQYYTFNSEVKKIYKRFDIMIEGLVRMNTFYINCIRLLINRIGLEKMYFIMEPDLNHFYSENQSVTTIERIKKNANDDTTIFNEIFVNLIKKNMKNNDILFSEIFYYENFKYRYFINKIHTPKIIKLNINIEKAIFSSLIMKEEYYIKYWFENGNIITTHLIPKKNDMHNKV